MPLILYYLPSFQRSLKKLSHEQLRTISLILEALTIYYGSGCDLIKASVIAPRFFYKQLRKPYYEAGVERDLRVVVRKEGEKCLAVIAGNHDQIRRFLAEN
jgi:hypothetical protein